MGAEFPGPAEDVVLAWILRLGEGRDPGEAAKRLIPDYELDRAPPPTGACGRLVAILRETAEFPTGRITRHLCQPRRRGGRRRHRPCGAPPAHAGNSRHRTPHAPTAVPATPGPQPYATPHPPPHRP